MGVSGGRWSSWWDRGGSPEKRHYERTVKALLRRDRAALDAALRAVTRAFAGRRSIRRRPAPTARVGKLPTFADHVEGEPFPDLPGLSSADVAAITRGLADLDAGRYRESNAMVADFREQLRNVKPGGRITV